MNDRQVFFLFLFFWHQLYCIFNLTRYVVCPTVCPAVVMIKAVLGWRVRSWRMNWSDRFEKLFQLNSLVALSISVGNNKSHHNCPRAVSDCYLLLVSASAFSLCNLSCWVEICFVNALCSVECKCCRCRRRAAMYRVTFCCTLHGFFSVSLLN